MELIKNKVKRRMYVFCSKVTNNKIGTNWIGNVNQENALRFKKVFSSGKDLWLVNNLRGI